LELQLGPSIQRRPGLTAADFGNAGTATVTIGSVSEGAPGVFTVQATPTTIGTLQFRVNAGAALTDTSANPLNTVSAIADDTTITVQTAYAAWAGGALFDADANGDGVKNGLAWILGAGSSSASAGNMVFTFKRMQTSINANTALTIDVGTTLTSWPHSFTVGTDTIGSTAGVVVTKDSPGVGTDTVTLTVAQSPDAKKFARLKAVQTP